MKGILSPQEQRLVATLVDWLHDQMVKSLTNTSPARDLLWDLAQSNFETGCGALARVGVLAREGMYWRVLPRNLVPSEVSRQDLDHLLDGLAIQTSYVTELHRQDEPFRAKDPLLVALCDALVGI